MDATPDTHESIDLVMQVNQMEVHAEDITENILAKRKADKERELGKHRSPYFSSNSRTRVCHEHYTCVYVSSQCNFYAVTLQCIR